jgi:predicted nucleotidyltransferase
MDLSAQHKQCVLNVLQRITPSAEVWVFGSRAGMKAKPYSDLDLIIENPHALTLSERADLEEAFSESDLPFKVDVVDWHEVGEGFKQSVEGKRVRLG